MEVDTDVKVKVKIIHPWVDPEPFGTLDIDFDVLSSRISGPFALLSQQREIFEWIDSDSCLWIKRDSWASKRQVAWQINVRQFAMYFQSLPLTGSGASVVISLSMQIDSTENLNDTVSVLIH